MDEPALHVTDIQQHRETVPDGQGGLQDVMNVHFTTPSGTRSHVVVPIDQYSAHNVARHIKHHLQHVEQVHSLEGQDLSNVPLD